MKTALGQLIEILEKAKGESLQDCKAARENGEDSQVHDTEFSVLSYAVKKATELLELEKKQIQDAHIFAHCEYGSGKIFPSEQEQKELAEDYYNKTFQK